MSDLAAILAEGERLYATDYTGSIYQRDLFFQAHGPLLLRLARAGAEMRKAEEAYRQPATWSSRGRAIAAWDAAFDAAREGKP